MSQTTFSRPYTNPNDSHSLLESIIGESDCMRQLKRRIRQFAEEHSIVLITGETGSGKERVAKALHDLGTNHAKPYIVLNCASLPESIIESELFGHEKGAFTGATDRRVGRFELAEDGTLFLDEIGELPLTQQAKLLRIIEGHPYERIGSNHSIANRARIIAATNRDLRQEFHAKRFREDLFFRLDVLAIKVPPLRERGSDIVLLANHFLHEQSERRGREHRFSDAALSTIMSYHWPGNVRELKNTIERAVIVANGEEVRGDTLSLNDAPIGSSRIYSREVEPFVPLPLAEVERMHIVKTYQFAGKSLTKTAELLGIHRDTVKRHIVTADLQ